MVAGGGLPVGSILLMEEDKIGRYAKCLTKLFLAEGSVHKHAMFVANLDADPNETVRYKTLFNETVLIEGILLTLLCSPYPLRIHR